MRKLLIISLLAMCSQAFGQAARFDGIALSTTSTGNPLTTVTVPLPSASITVYNYGTLTKASVCPDITAVGCTTIAPNNPITADARGNFGFWIAGGVYQYTVCPVGGVCQGPYNAVVPFGSNSSGSITYSKSFENIRFADQFSSTQAAFTDAGTTGGVMFPPNYTIGTFSNPNKRPVFDFTRIDWRGFVDVRDYGAKCDGSTDDSTSIQLALTNSVLAGTKTSIPSGVTCVHNTALTLGAASLQLDGTLKAGAAMTYQLTVGTASVEVPRQSVFGIGTFDGNNLATGALWLKRVREYEVASIHTLNHTTYGIVAGDATGTTSYGVNIHDTVMVGNSASPGAIGLWDNGATDSKFTSNIAVDFVIGMQNDKSQNRWFLNHAWSHGTPASMTSAFYDTAGWGTVWSGNEIDTPKTYGLRVGAAANNTLIVGNKFFMNSDVEAQDNVAIGIKFDNATPAASIIGNHFYGQSGSFRWAQDISSASTSNVTIWGNPNTNVVTQTLNRVPNLDDFTVGTATATKQLSINGPAASNRQFDYLTAGVNRWIARANSTAEGGANAGSDFELVARDDSGAFLATTLACTRSTSDCKFAGNISPSSAGGKTAGTNALPFSSVFVGNAATNNAQLTGTFTAARVQTLPDVTGTVSLVDAKLCGTTSTCANTTQTLPRIIFGSVALASASPSAVTVSGISPAFTSTSSYFCTATPVGATAAIAAGGIAVTNVSSSSFTLTGPNTVTTVINYTCVGN